MPIYYKKNIVKKYIKEFTDSSTGVVLFQGGEGFSRLTLF